MGDDGIGTMARFAAELRYEDVPAETISAAKQRIVDTLGCGAGAAHSEPARIARAMAAEYQTTRGATCLGLATKTTPEMAAFANGVMIRYLDFNDASGSTNVTGSHPSDMIPGILALAESCGASGRAAILGIVAGYQSNWALPGPFNKLGWDQGIQMGTAVAMGCGIVLGLDAGRIAHAIALAITPHLPLRVTRSGELSMWKAGATAAAARTGVFAALMAERGMTGPDRVLEGRHGLFDQIGMRFEVPIDPRKVGWRIGTSDLKGFPMANAMHTVVATLLEMLRKVAPAEIATIEVRAHGGLYSESGSEPEKWDPKTRETADHSLPYVMARAIRDGGVTIESFTADAIADPTLRPLMNSITVIEEPTFTKLKDGGGEATSEITIVTRAGKRETARTGIVRGHHLNPMSDAELNAKFTSLARRIAQPDAIERALGALWSLDEAPDVGTPIAAWAALAG